MSRNWKRNTELAGAARSRKATQGRFATDRRSFLTTAGAAALAVQLDVLDFASSLFAGEPSPRSGPRVSVAFFRRAVGPGLHYPSATTAQLKEIQALFTKTLEDAGARFGVELDMQAEPVTDVSACLARLKKTAPDGLIIVAGGLWKWKFVNELVAKRGGIPTVVYANVTGFSGHYKHVSKFPHTLVASTPDVSWLAHAVRMFRAHWRLKHLKLLRCPTRNYYDELKKVGESEEVRAIADYYAKSAKAIVEPNKEQILAAAKHYVVLRRLMKLGGCDGVTVAGPLCIGAKGEKANPACIAVSKLLDEGVPAACEGDVQAARCQMLTLSLFGRPGFMGNPSPNTVDNTFIVTHCTSALKLEGIDKPYRAPFVLRNFHAMGGVCPMVAWPLGKEATILDFLNNTSMIVSPGRIVRNTEQIAQPPCGGCRTSVEFSVDGVPNTADILAGHHKWCILGNYARPIRNYCKLAGIRVADLAGKAYPA